MAFAEVDGDLLAGGDTVVEPGGERDPPPAELAELVEGFEEDLRGDVLDEVDTGSAS